MPRLINRNPAYRKHRASGQAIVTIDGQDIYLGPFGTQASRNEYDRIIGEWLANGRRLSTKEVASDLAVNFAVHKNETCRRGDPCRTARLRCVSHPLARTADDKEALHWQDVSASR